MEPLLTTKQRIEFDQDFREVARRDARWFSAYCAGVISGIASSLPPSDPWRKVRVEVDGVPRWPDGHTFGAREDTDDIIQPIMELQHVGIDPTTMALENDVSSAVGALVAISFTGWKSGFDVLSKTAEREGPDVAFDEATSAIQWALHRRRSYRPEVFDTWLDALTIGWAGWADYACDGELSVATEAEIERGAEVERETLEKIATDLGFFS